MLIWIDKVFHSRKSHLIRLESFSSSVNPAGLFGYSLVVTNLSFLTEKPVDENLGGIGVRSSVKNTQAPTAGTGRTRPSVGSRSNLKNNRGKCGDARLFLSFLIRPAGRGGRLQNQRRDRRFFDAKNCRLNVVLWLQPFV